MSEYKMRRTSLVGVFASLILMVSTAALADSPNVVVDQSATAELHGVSDGYHFHISVFAGRSEALIPNAAVRVEVFDSDHKLVGDCGVNEKQLDDPASFEADAGLISASFSGVYADSGCFWGDATFDLVWSASGSLLNESSVAGEPGEFCLDTYQERSAKATGMVQFTSGPSTSPFLAESDSATIRIESRLRCLMPGAPQPG